MRTTAVQRIKKEIMIKLKRKIELALQLEQQNRTISAITVILPGGPSVVIQRFSMMMSQLS
jgi:hypothetical protein